MKEISFMSLLILVFLSGCFGDDDLFIDESKLDSDFHFANLYYHDTKIKQYTDKSEVKHIIKKINTSSKQSTENMRLKKPEGKLVLSNQKTSIEVGLFENGDILYEGYLIDTNFDYFKDYHMLMLTIIEIEDLNTSKENLMEFVFKNHLEKHKDIFDETIKIKDFKINNITITKEYNATTQFSVNYDVLPFDSDEYVYTGNGKINKDTHWIKERVHFVSVVKEMSQNENKQMYRVLSKVTSPK